MDDKPRAAFGEEAGVHRPTPDGRDRSPVVARMTSKPEITGHRVLYFVQFVEVEVVHGVTVDAAG